MCPVSNPYLEPGKEQDEEEEAASSETKEGTSKKEEIVENVAQEGKETRSCLGEIEQKTKIIGVSCTGGGTGQEPPRVTDRGSAATKGEGSYSESQAGDEEQEIWRQIEALNSVCHVRFSCTVALCTGESTESVLSPKKKAKLSSTERVSEQRGELECVLVEFHFIRGDSRDLLHQIVQYLKNTTFRLS